MGRRSLGYCKWARRNKDIRAGYYLLHLTQRPVCTPRQRYHLLTARRTGWRSSILLRIDAEFLHSRKESRAVHSQDGGSTIGTADAPLAGS
jgi:hypothetical protein